MSLGKAYCKAIYHKLCPIILKAQVQKIRQKYRPVSEAPPVRHPWEEVSHTLKGHGFTEPLLFLSFDCDTDLDIPAAKTLAYSLRELGIESTFAVPGAQLERGADVFSGMAADGFEFMNHGSLPHTEWDGEKYIPATFYAEMPITEVEADIRKADALVRKITGMAPQGFRAPHFGSFQSAQQINFMHRICADLGYTYASTTMPTIAMERGPFFINHGIVELPLTGSWREPYNIPDSWSNLSDRVNFTLSARFFDLWQESFAAVYERNMSMLLCWYVDPAHVINQKPFENAVKFIARSGIRSVTGSECAELCRMALETKNLHGKSF